MNSPSTEPVGCATTDVAEAAKVHTRQATLQNSWRRPICLLFTLSVILLLPILIGGFPRLSDDGETHVRWQHYYGTQLWAGDFFPRWLADIADGFGSPAFFIYPPLPHYVAALLTPFSESIEWVQHRLGIATLLACFLGSAGCFLWFKQITRNRESALIGATVYLIAPYHLFIDTYFRAAYAELWAFAFAPLALAGIHLMTSRRRTGLSLYILGMTALLMSHAPSALIFLPLFMVYSCLTTLVFRRADILFWTGVGTCTGILLAGAYLGTALTQQKYINTAELYTGYFNFNNWLIFNPNPVSKLAFNITGVLQATATVLLAGVVVARKAGEKELRWLALLTIVGTCLLFFMMTSFSAVVWALIPSAQKIQFPWRLQTIQTILLALSAALCLGIIKSEADKNNVSGSQGSRKRAGLVLVVVLLGSNAAMMYRWPPKFDISAPIRSVETAEYTLGDGISASKYFLDHDKVVIAKGDGTLRLIRWQARNIEFDIDSITPTEIAIKQFAYTGWTCTSAGMLKTCTVLSRSAGDILRVEVAPGSHRLTLIMPEQDGERWGRLASLAGLIIAATSIVFAGRARQCPL